jgi:hypothetical protein
MYYILCSLTTMKYSLSIFIPNRFEAQQTVVYRDGHANISINATVQLTSVDESKLNLIFCVKHIGSGAEAGIMLKGGQTW